MTKLRFKKFKTKFANKSGFTSEEAKKLGISASQLAYYIKKNQIERISRGVYKFKIENSEFNKWEDLIQATKTISDGVVCLISALSYYELTDEIPRQHWIAIAHSRRISEKENIKIIRMRNFKLGQEKIKIAEDEIKIFNMERTIVDSFRFLSLEIAIKALKLGIKRVSLSKLRKYSKDLHVNIEAYIMAVLT